MSRFCYICVWARNWYRYDTVFSAALKIISLWKIPSFWLVFIFWISIPTALFSNDGEDQLDDFQGRAVLWFTAWMMWGTKCCCAYMSSSPPVLEAEFSNYTWLDAYNYWILQNQHTHPSFLGFLLYCRLVGLYLHIQAYMHFLHSFKHLLGLIKESHNQKSFEELCSCYW